MFPRLIAFALAGAVSACGGGLPEPNAVDAERAGARWPSVKVADLAQGRDLYQGRCASCHQLYEPHAFSPEKWEIELHEMSARARLSEPQELLILQYLVSVSGRGGAETATSPTNAQEQ
jgi:mono/diheme cytochrome c family protein